MPAIDLDAISRILHLIAKMPNHRTIPNENDLSGDYDIWFDGGALKITTGIKEYYFDDGSTAVQSVSLLLNISIRISGGPEVRIVEVK